MAEHERQNWLIRYSVGYKILAVCLAFLLWYFVAGQRAPLSKQTFTRQVELRFLSSELVSSAPLPSVTVTVSGMKMLMQTLQDKDIHVYADVSAQTAGVAVLPVKTSVPDNIQVLSVYPQAVSVSLDYWEEKKVPVKVVLQGNPAPGYMTLTPAVTPAQVTVRGPRSSLSGVQEAQAMVAVAGVNVNVTQKAPVQVTYQHEKLEVKPDVVEVIVPVAPSGPIKTVPVTAAVRGTPGLAQAVQSVLVEPAMVELTGSPEALSGLFGVSTQPVDISGAIDRVVRDVALELPPGVYPVSQGQVRVTVELSAAATPVPQL